MIPTSDPSVNGTQENIGSRVHFITTLEEIEQEQPRYGRI